VRKLSELYPTKLIYKEQKFIKVQEVIHFGVRKVGIKAGNIPVQRRLDMLKDLTANLA
jgi:hypothetical protein